MTNYAKILAIGLAAASVPGASASTLVGGGGNFGDSTIWTSGSIPSQVSPYSGVNLGSSTAVTINLKDASGVDTSYTISSLSGATGSANQTITGASGVFLTFDTGISGSNAVITLNHNSGKHTVISADVILNSNLSISTQNADGALQFTKTISGTGGLIINANNGTTWLSGTGSTYTGDTVINSGGRLVVKVTNGISTASALVANGFLDLQAHDQTVVSLSGTSPTGTIFNSTSGTSTLTVNSAINTNFAGNIADNTGAMALVKQGVGALTLSGTNNFSGNTTVSNGSLVLANTQALQNATVLTGGSGIVFDSSVASHAFNIGALTGTNGLVLADNASNAVALSLGGVSVNVSASYGGSLTGAGSLTKISGGVLTLTGTNNYAGTTTVSGGLLAITNRYALYNGNNAQWTAANLIIQNSGTLAFNVGSGPNDITVAEFTALSQLGTGSGGFLNGSTIGLDTTSGSLTYGAVIANTNGGSNSIGFTKLGVNTLTLTATNTYTGATTIGNGVLSVSQLANGGVASAIGASSNAAGNLVFDGGTLQYTGTSVVTDRNFTINTNKTAAIDTANDLTLGGDGGMANNGGLTKMGAGTLTLTGSTGFTGTVTINAGALKLANAGALGSGVNNVVFGSNAPVGTKLQLNGNSITIGSLSTDPTTVGSPVVENGSAGVSATLTSNTTSSGTFGGVLQDGGAASLGFAKLGASSLTLTGNDTYTGATTVNSGTLVLNGGGRTASTSGYTITNGLFFADNTTTFTVNRLANAPVTLATGTFNITGKSGSSTIESVGTLTFDSGANFISLSGTSTGQTNKLTVASLARNNNAVALVRGSLFGQTSLANQLVVTSAPTGSLVGGGGSFTSGTTTNISIIPYLVGDGSAAGEGTTFVGYDSATGDLRALKVGEFHQFVGLATADLTTAGATENVRISGSGAVGTVGVTASTVNSVIFNNFTGTGTTNYNIAGTLTPTSGAVLFTRNASGTTARVQNLNGGLIQFNSAEGVITNTSGAAVNINTPISGSGGLTLTTYNANSSIVLGSVANNYTGKTTINGSVKLGASEVITDSSAVYVSQGSTLSITSVTSQVETIGSLSGNGAVSLAATSGATLITGGDGTSTTFGGVISGASGALTKTGAGTQTLTGANTYTGATTVNGGGLRVNGSLAGGGAVTVSNANTTLSGFGTISGTATISSGAILAPGSGAVGTLTVGGLTLSGGSILNYEFNGTANDLTAVTNALTLNSGTVGINLFQEGGTNQFTTAGTYDLFSYGSLTGGVSNLSVLNPNGSNTYTFGTTTISGTNYVTLTIAGGSATSTTYSLTAIAGSTNILTGGTTGISSTIQNTGSGSADTLNYSNLTAASGSGGSISGSPTSGGPLGQGQSGTNGGLVFTGTKSGAVTVTAVGSGTNATAGGPATQTGTSTATVNVYDPAVLSGSNLLASNLGGSFRASAKITSDGGLSNNQGGFTNVNVNGQQINSGTSTTVASFDSTGKLNGTYTATKTVGYDNVTSGGLTITGGTGNTANLTLTATVSGQTAGAGQVLGAPVFSGQKYGTTTVGGTSSGYGITSNIPLDPHSPTTATIINGTASAATTVLMSFDKVPAGSEPDSAFRVSDILTLSGLVKTGGTGHDGSTLTDIYVLQLSYDSTATGQKYLGWYDATQNQWVNAVAGNSTGGTYDGTGEYVGSYASYLASLSVPDQTNLAAQLGAFGYDASTHTAWAVIDHESEFAVIPEPGTWGMIISGFGMLIGFQRLRKRRVGT